MILSFKKWLAKQVRLNPDGTETEEALELHGVDSEATAQAEIVKRINTNFHQGEDMLPTEVRIEKKERTGAHASRTRILFLATILWRDGEDEEYTKQEKVVAEIRLRHKKGSTSSAKNNTALEETVNDLNTVPTEADANHPAHDEVGAAVAV